MLRCETHFHKWGRIQRMKPNDSQVHSHFGDYICAGISNGWSLGWKRKISTKLGPHDTIKKVLNLKCLKFSLIVHLHLICMSYDQKKGRSQIGNLIFDHKPFESRGQIKYDWSKLYSIGKIFSRVIRFCPCTLKINLI